jgi:hypothetical protein
MMYDTMNTQRSKEPNKGNYAIAEALASGSLAPVAEYIGQDLAVEDVPLALLGENYRLAALQCLTGAKNSLTTLYGNRPNALQEETAKTVADQSSVRESLVFEEEIQQFVVNLRDSVRRIAEPDKTKPVDLSPLKQAIMQTDRVIETFSDEDREKYAGRIVRGLKDVTADPKETKVVLLDDWTISGGQLKTAYHNLAFEPEFKKLAKSVEINLLTASKGRIINGLPTRERGMPNIPVRAYYQSHHSDNSRTPQEGRVSGSHSSVDYDFEIDINDMLTEMNTVSEANGQPAELMPPPTNIVRTYSYSPAKFVLDKHGTFVPNPAAKESNSEKK